MMSGCCVVWVMMMVNISSDIGFLLYSWLFWDISLIVDFFLWDYGCVFVLFKGVRVLGK